MVEKIEIQLHDNHPCCGCGPHCLEECPNFHVYEHPQWSRTVYCSYVQKDLTYYDGGMLAACHDGFSEEEMEQFFRKEQGDDRVIKIEVLPKT